MPYKYLDITRIVNILNRFTLGLFDQHRGY